MWKLIYERLIVKSGLGNVPVITLLIAWCVQIKRLKSADIEHT